MNSQHRHAGLWAQAMVFAFVWSEICASSAQPRFTLVKGGVSRALIVVVENAPPLTRRAADELALYIEKVSGARPEVFEGLPDPLPGHAVWVGYQPALDRLFPDVDFELRYPEEILIAATSDHLAIAGRDRWVPEHSTVEVPVWGSRLSRVADVQIEYGTANAVYTFVQDYLNVRWLWPGDLGEDILPRDTLTFAPFTCRYHPQIRQRDILYRHRLLAHRFARHDHWADWSRFQRLQLGSLRTTAGVHAFSDWVDRFYETHPDYFALQPDGSRRSWGSRKGDAKICLSNPAVWEQWFRDAQAKLRHDPTMTALAAAENDGHSSWICACENCRAWDHPKGAPWRYTWKGIQKEYVAMTDRYISFWNVLARGLTRRFPDRNDLLVLAAAYGPSKPLPVKARLEKNTILSYVGNFPGTGADERRSGQKAEWKAWEEVAPQMVYRPNLFYHAGGSFGLPEIVLNETMEDFRFLAEHRCTGITIDMPPETWGTMAPQYYLMAQLAWNPRLDGAAVMADYYRRGFGPAAAPIEKYWALIEGKHKAILATPEYKYMLSGPWRRQIPVIFPRAYNADFLARADAVLRQAEERTAGGTEAYAKRVAFVRAGLDFLRLMIETIPVMTRVRESGGTDVNAVREALANWEKIQKIDETTGGYALDHVTLRARMHYRAFYKAGVEDYFGPPSKAFQRAAGLLPDAGGRAPKTPPAKTAAQAKQTPATVAAKVAKGGWILVFSDDFKRDRLGDNWRVLDGEWAVADGQLTGHGTLMLDKAFPGFQRLEFEAATDAGTVSIFGKDQPAEISDLSAFVQASPNADPTRNGYLLQFGGQRNTLHRLLRAGKTLRSDENPSVRIKPTQRHRIVAENDAGRVRLTVDGRVLLEGTEGASFVGSGQDRAGLYLYTPARVFSVKLYVKPLADDSI